MSLKRKALDSLGILKDMLLDFLRLSHGYALGLISIIILGFLFELAGWWYLMLLAGGLGGFFMKKNGLLSFVIGFIGIALVWSMFFIYFMIIGPIFELTALITSLLGFLEAVPNVLILITVVIGGLLGGLGAVNGTYIANLIYDRKTPSKELKLDSKKSPNK
ncbi:MAG: hypothetical protein HWN66_16500 [Candidatus Helarchaeota archaeon]|nr:hypothetical protein [Candidatus Helarchaeota archaeon]